jgi:hypothetical protein
VARSCRVLGVARSGYYRWLHGETRARAVDDAVLGGVAPLWRTDLTA